MRRAIVSLSPYVFLSWCLFKHRDNFTFLKFIKILSRAATLWLGRTCTESQRLASASNVNFFSSSSIMQNLQC
jgi:hypothetical protein